MYVNDIILTGNDSVLIDQFITRINFEFVIKDLGRLSYFLGLEVSFTLDGLILSQTKYAQEILACAQLLESKPVRTPLAPIEQSVRDGDEFSNPTLY